MMKIDLPTRLETTLAHLVQIPSVPSDPVASREIIAYVRDEFTPYNLHISGEFTADHPWLLATTRDTMTPGILLVAHLDVVHAKEYQLEKRDGKFYGRGVYDMKFAAACYLELLKNHADQLKNLNIGFLFTTDEELGGDSMPVILEKTNLRPKVAFIPDGGDNWSVEKQAKGFYHVELTAHGKAAHGSRPWEGDNALHRLMDVLQILRASHTSQHPSESSLALARLHSGKAINQIPDEASAVIDFRSFDQDAIELYRTQIKQLAKEYQLEVRVAQDGLPLHFDKDAPVVQSFLTALREHTGKDISYSESYGGTDGRYFAKYNIPCIIVEPNGGGRHAATEWLLAEDLEKYYRLIGRWLFGS